MVAELGFLIFDFGFWILEGLAAGSGFGRRDFGFFDCR
jgi:hypothetical protein